MLSTEWLKAFAPVGILKPDNQWAAFGACVFFRKPPVLWMVTANHVVEKVGPHGLTVLVTPSSGGGPIVVEVGKILAQNDFSWVQDRENDLAAAPMPTSRDFDITAVSSDNCLRLADLVPSMPCFTIGCPYGVYGVDPQRATPLVLDGIISGVDAENRKVFTSAPTFPGNSGGPLIAVRSPFDPGGKMSIGRPIVFIAGIMLETRLYWDPNIFQQELEKILKRIPSLHLGIAAPMDAVLSMLESDQAREIAARVESMRSG